LYVIGSRGRDKMKSNSLLLELSSAAKSPEGEMMRQSILHLHIYKRYILCQPVLKVTQDGNEACTSPARFNVVPVNFHGL